jgi:hypothetical protein
MRKAIEIHNITSTEFLPLWIHIAGYRTILCAASNTNNQLIKVRSVCDSGSE